MLKEQPCNVAAGPSEIVDVTKRDRVVVDRNHEDGDRGGGSLDGTRCGSGARNNHVCIETYQFGSKIGQSIDFSLGVPIFEDNILTFEVSQLAQSALK
jgi:hypothetical protein